jgi:hypothetical protein
LADLTGVLWSRQIDEKEWNEWNLNLKTPFVINAVFALMGGLGELLTPQQLVGSFVPSLDAGGEFIARNTGAFQLGTAVISFLARNIQDRAALKAIRWWRYNMVCLGDY